MYCVTECGACGGVGRRDRAEVVVLSADDYFLMRVRASGVYYDDSEAASYTMGSGARPSCRTLEIIFSRWRHQRYRLKI